MQSSEDLVNREVTANGLRLEWITDIGIGVSLPEDAGDDVLLRIPETIKVAVWLNFDGTGITDVGIKALERAPVLESIRLVNTGITANGIVSLLKCISTLRQITLSYGTLDASLRDGIQKSHRNVHLIEREALDRPTHT